MLPKGTRGKGGKARGRKEGNKPKKKRDYAKLAQPDDDDAVGRCPAAPWPRTPLLGPCSARPDGTLVRFCVLGSCTRGFARVRVAAEL